VKFKLNTKFHLLQKLYCRCQYPAVLQNAIKDFHSAPAAYALGFGIDDKGTMKLVECNDGYSLGTYGIGAVNYAKFLSARWSQLTHTQDFANF